jgi:hypothetical protein
MSKLSDYPWLTSDPNHFPAKAPGTKTFLDKFASEVNAKQQEKQAGSYR